MIGMISVIAVGLALVAPERPLSFSEIKGPALVVLLKDGCPCTRECRAELNLLAHVSRGKVRFLGLLDAGAGSAKALAKEAELEFSVLPDPKRTAIGRLSGTEALDFRLLGAGGKVIGRWNGLSRTNVALIARAIGKASGQPVKIDLSPFTVLTKYGCAYSDQLAH